ncbi:hypothetical protein EOM39_07370, partial [Candidatus Gracilibacteria bacterium]|nr:hypothetical protein [Candidatus Gracilibacteria bacterium]
KIQQEYVNNKGVTKIRTIREEYTETNTYYYEKDEKGSITKITDKDGTTIEQYLYDAYGTPYTKTQSGELVTISNLKPSLIGNTRLYTGREYDRGLQLYYNRARYYNPQLGRFISRDPIDISDDVNLYTYVGNNPVNYVDRMGLEKILIMYSPNHFRDTFSTEANAEILFNSYLNSGYKKENIQMVSIDSAEDFIDDINNSGITKGKIIYVGHNQGWLSPNMTDEEINKLNPIDSDNVTMDLYACSTIIGADNTVTRSNQIAQKLANQLEIKVTGSSTYEYEKDGIFYGTWGYVTPGTEIRRVPSLLDYIISPAY